MDFTVVLLFFYVFPNVLEAMAVAIANNENEKQNFLIKEEERRGAEHIDDDIKTDETELKKRGLFLVPVQKQQHYYTTNDYEHGYGGNSGPSYYYGSDYEGNHNIIPNYHGHGYTTGGGGLGTYGFHPSSHGGGGGGGHEYHGEDYGHHHEIVPHHHESGLDGHSVFGLKSLLIPLAGIALLGAAAALSTNPVLLQLGVLNGRRRRRRRRRRSLPSTHNNIKSDNDVYPANPFLIKPIFYH